ncbi:MAG: radical SAM protein [Candidatus Omnitrophica bacterium]|nr:radical SAM protein [Candidatus Omnitrophota bacterium]
MVLLINPWIYDFAAYNFGIKPVGLLRIASHLRSRTEVCLLDCLENSARSKKEYGFSKIRKERVEKPDALMGISRPYFRYGISIESFKEKISKMETPEHIYMTSGMTYWYQGVMLAVRLLKESFPGTPVTLGGVYATLCPSHAGAKSGADYVYVGKYEGENKEYFPAYDLLAEKDILPIRLSSGCPFGCSYCASNILDPGFEQYNPAEVSEEIMHCHRAFGTNNFVFYDDALCYKPDSGIKKLLRLIMDSGVKLNFHTPNGLHAAFLDEELACLLKETGFKAPRISLETSDKELQRFTGGKVCNDDIKKAVFLLEEAGFERNQIGVYVLIGYPWLSLEKTVDDIRFVASLGAKVVLASYSPIPGTEDYTRLIESGIMREDTDPVWHNKAIFAERLTPGATEKIARTRRMVSKLYNGSMHKNFI